jgi:hypothetical protein
MRVRHVNFAKRGKEFSGIVGMADWENETIFIDNRLPKVNHGTRKAVENHERAHIWLDKSSLKHHLNKRQTEEFCDLIAMFSTPDEWLSDIEVIAKKALLRGRSWRKDRKSILDDICHWVGAYIKAKREV